MMWFGRYLSKRMALLCTASCLVRGCVLAMPSDASVGCKDNLHVLMLCKLILLCTELQILCVFFLKVIDLDALKPPCLL